MVGAVEAWAAVVAPEFPPALAAWLGWRPKRPSAWAGTAGAGRAVYAPSSFGRSSSGSLAKLAAMRAEIRLKRCRRDDYVKKPRGKARGFALAL
jgi:hypothetical protein